MARQKEATHRSRSRRKERAREDITKKASDCTLTVDGQDGYTPQIRRQREQERRKKSEKAPYSTST